MNEKTQIITNDIIQSLDALYNLCSDISERIGSTQNQNVDAGNEDMALLSDNLTRLQGRYSGARSASNSSLKRSKRCSLTYKK